MRSNLIFITRVGLSLIIPKLSEAQTLINLYTPLPLLKLRANEYRIHNLGEAEPTDVKFGWGSCLTQPIRSAAYDWSDAPIDLKIKTHMICDLLNLSSIPCTDPAIYSNKQRQQKMIQILNRTNWNELVMISWIQKKRKKGTFFDGLKRKKKKSRNHRNQWNPPTLT